MTDEKRFAGKLEAFADGLPGLQPQGHYLHRMRLDTLALLVLQMKQLCQHKEGDDWIRRRGVSWFCGDALAVAAVGGPVCCQA